MLIIHLAQNIALLISLSFLHGLIINRLPNHPILRTIASGVLFGCVALIGMLVPVFWESGIIFDGRSIILCIAGLFGGPITALIAAVISAIYRIWLGGIGTVMGISVIIESTSLGVAFYYLRRKYPDILTSLNLYLFGLIVHAIMVALMLTLPQSSTLIALQKVALPVLLVYPPAVVISALLFIRNESFQENITRLRQSEAKNRLLFEQAAVGIAEITADGRFQHPNYVFCQITGYSASELEQLHFQEITHPDDLHLDEKYIKEVMDGHRDSFEIEKRYIHKDGYPFWIHLYSNAIRDTAGSPVYAIITIVDITQRKQTEEDQKMNYRATRNLLEDLSREIDERKAIEDKISKSEKQYRLLFEKMMDAFALHEMIFDKDGKPMNYRFISVNPAFEKLTGLKARNIIGKTVLDILPDTEIYWIDTYGKAVKTSMPIKFENYSKELNRYYEGIAYSPEPGKFATIFQDVTEQKNNRKSLEKIHSHYRQALTNAKAVPYLIYYDSPYYEFISEEIEKYTGYPAGEFPFSIWRKIKLETIMYGEAGGLPFEKAGQLARSGKIKTWLADYKIRTRNGDIRWLSDSSVQITDDHGKSIGALGLLQDITEKHLAEENIHFQAMLLDQIKDGIIATDLKGNITYANATETQILGKSLSKIIGTSVISFDENSENGASQKQIISETLKKGFWRGEVVNKLPNGKSITWDSRIQLIEDQNGQPKGMIGISTNISERKDFINRLEKSERNLRALAGHLQNVREDERKAIAREIHDEIAQIITALKIDISILGSDLQNNSALDNKYSSEIESMKNLIDATVKRVRDLIHRLRPEDLESLGLIEAIRSSVNKLSQKNQINGHFKTYVKTINLNPEKSLAFYRIFQEALLNSVRHANAKNIHVSLQSKEETLVLKMRDDGNGFDFNKLDKPDSFGIIGMRERALFLDGKLTIKGKTDYGTEIILEVPNN